MIMLLNPPTNNFSREDCSEIKFSNSPTHSRASKMRPSIAELPKLHSLNKDIQAAEVLKSFVGNLPSIADKMAFPPDVSPNNLKSPPSVLPGRSPLASPEMKQPSNVTKQFAGKIQGVRLAVEKKPIRRCNVEGCTKYARKGGICVSHGAKVKVIRCKVQGCGKYAVRQGVCKAHGAKVKRCSVEGCTKGSVRGGVCISHGATIKTCRVTGCNKVAKRGGVCISHGSEVKRCSVAGCRKMDVADGMCAGHGEKMKRCTVAGCDKTSKTRGMCTAHAQVTVTFCMISECSFFAKVQGQCLHHFSGRLPGGGPNVGVQPNPERLTDEDQNEDESSESEASEEAKELQFKVNLDPASRYYY